MNHVERSNFCRLSDGSIMKIPNWISQETVEVLMEEPAPVSGVFLKKKDTSSIFDISSTYKS